MQAMANDQLLERSRTVEAGSGNDRAEESGDQEAGKNNAGFWPCANAIFLQIVDF
jgi:hypothetical protein